MSKIKLLVVLLLCIFLLPFMVNAEECNPNSIKIQSISVKDKSEYTEELSNITFENNKINLDLKMYDVGDYIEYKLKVKNESKENFYFDEKSLNINSNYFDYSLSYKDNSNKIEPNTEKIIYLRVEYKKEVEKENFFSGKYKDSNIVSLLLTDNKRSIFTNPLTGSNKIILLLITMIILGIYLYYKKTNNIRLNIFIIIGLSLLIPISTYALCEVKLDINSNITIGKVKPNPCTYDGELVQGAEYVNGQYTYRYMQEGTSRWDSNLRDYLFDWKNIDEDGWGVTLTNKNSTESVTSKLCTSINNKPIKSSSNMFYKSKASKFDMSSFDTSNITNMEYTFACIGETSDSVKILGLSNWDTSKVINMKGVFVSVGINSSEVFLDDISNWDISNVTNLYQMFQGIGSLNVDLSKWNTSKVENMSYMFANTGRNSNIWNVGNLSNWSMSSIKDIRSMFEYAGSHADKIELNISNWDLSNIIDNYSSEYIFHAIGMYAKKVSLNLFDWILPKNLYEMFYNAGEYAETIEIIGLSSWDTSKVENMSNMFGYVGYEADIVNIDDLSGWDTSNVTNMESMFSSVGGYKAKKLYIEGLSNWDVSNVTNMDSMFCSIGRNAKEWGIGDLSKWNVSNVRNMAYMFDLSGSNTEDWNIGNLSNWNTSNVIDMRCMFDNAGQNSKIWDIGNLSNWNTSNIIDMSYMFAGAGMNTESWNSIGTLNIYNSDIDSIFINNPQAKTTINLHNNLTSYNNAFKNAATSSGSGITVNYASDVTSIDDIIATKSSNSNVVKGSLIN